VGKDDDIGDDRRRSMVFGGYLAALKAFRSRGELLIVAARVAGSASALPPSSYR
jgi:hypothetical protein